MATIGLTLVEVTSLRYFIPIFLELDSRGEEFVIFCDRVKSKPTGMIKNNNVEHLQKWKEKVVWFDSVDDLLKKITSRKLEYIISAEADPFRGLIFKKDWKLVVIPTLTDYIDLFPTYSSICDIFLSPGPMADNYLSYPAQMKVIHVGCPKYDVIPFLAESNSEEKTMTIFAPNKNLLIKSFFILYLLKIWSKKSGHRIVLKTRPKHNSKMIRFLFPNVVLDDNFFPSTSLDLIHKSSLVIMFDSVTFKECLLLNRPFINFNIKSYRSKRPVLHDFFSKSSDGKTIIDFKGHLVSPKTLFRALEQFNHSDTRVDLKDITAKWFWAKAHSSKQIIDYLIGPSESTTHASV